MNQTQNERILKYLRANGSITPQEAYQMSIMRLASRISDLKSCGHKITRVMEKGKNKYGEAVTYARYYLNED